MFVHFLRDSYTFSLSQAEASLAINRALIFQAYSVIAALRKRLAITSAKFLCVFSRAFYTYTCLYITMSFLCILVNAYTDMFLAIFMYLFFYIYVDSFAVMFYAMCCHISVAIPMNMVREETGR
jgi:hypothetical protein